MMSVRESEIWPKCSVVEIHFVNHVEDLEHVCNKESHLMLEADWANL